jgi:hypothetical protein
LLSGKANPLPGICGLRGGGLLVQAAGCWFMRMKPGIHWPRAK